LVKKKEKVPTVGMATVLNSKDAQVKYLLVANRPTGHSLQKWLLFVTVGTSQICPHRLQR
jgi:hypothetical protein